MAEKSWAMRKRDLPGYPWSPFDYTSRVWRGEHPSPAFKGCLVWWYYKSDPSVLSSFFKQVYAKGIDDLIPKNWTIDGSK